jgi:hypothetical protein
VQIAWGSLGQVLLVGLIAGAGGVTVFGIGVLGLSRAAVGREAGRSDPVGFGVAGLCFLVCAAAVVYGIYLIIPQFH